MKNQAKAININDFVGKNDPREWLQRPFPIKGKLAATDGKTAFLSEVEATGEKPDTDKLEKVERFFELAASADFYPAPELNFPEMPACDECNGNGKAVSATCPECDGWGDATAETDYNAYEVECRTCHGSGKVKSGGPAEICEACGGAGQRWKESDRMKIKGIPFDMNPGLISRIAHVPGLQIAALKSDELSGSMAFKCADGIGIIMGMRDKP